MQPLANSHPQLTISNPTPGVREYRVANWHLSYDGSGRIIRNAGWGWQDLFIVIGLCFWGISSWGNFSFLGGYIFPLLVLFYIKTKSTQLLWESILSIPSYGVQLESYRGIVIPWFRVSQDKNNDDIQIPLLTDRRFIPVESLCDVYIGEGFRRWQVRYYLALLTTNTQPEGKSSNDLKIRLVFEDILPPFPILEEVYHGVREDMFDEYLEASDSQDA